MTTKPELAKWIAIGAGVGAAVGAATDNMGLWVAIGVALGAASVLGKRCA
ncbi:MAG TPA: hypothetical protein VGI57_15800 [Usitatibacter sp.]|jgi:hypothetical protein